MTNAKTILKKYWGFDTFRQLQEDIINGVLDGKNVLALLPTGGGKSICFQIPAMMKEGICIVVSPLIALMKDQVQNLSKKGINALAIYSGMSYMEVKRTLQNAAYGNYKFLYVSPERLETDLFQEYLPALQVSLVAIDEAHCISQWGYDFRPSYLKISSLREQLPDVPVIALTASATVEVQNDICEKLMFDKNHLRFRQSFERPNLAYSVRNPSAKQSKLIEILETINGSAVVYCKSRKQTQQISDLLKLHQINADYYHAGLTAKERTEKQDNWIINKTKVIVCTNAFGMGIDKPDVRVVVHVNIPESLENYYQEAGRAGRDGRESNAVLLFDENEIGALYEMNRLRFPDKEELKQTYTDLMNFLQVPAGIGEDRTIDFDIATFCDRFKRNILQTNYSLQALADEGLIMIHEKNLRPSILVFAVSKTELDEFEKTMPEFEPVIKALLRNYEGIFDYPSSIYETVLAKFTSIPIEKIKKQLLQLQQIGIVDYSPQSESPKILLLQNRMYSDDFKINLKEQKARKEKHLQRIEAIVGYVKNQSQCRSVYIGNYFSDDSIRPCGVCDVCNEKSKEKIKNKSFKEVSSLIMKKAVQNKIALNDIKDLSREKGEEHINSVLDYLIAENVISLDKSGKFFVVR